jgi:hypothetical protein
MMVSTLKEAIRHNMDIQRDVRLYAIDKNGIMHVLRHDWTAEILDRELVKAAVEKGSAQ